MDISVIIPCYNASGYIEKCLKELEEQIFNDFEVICIDDCSTDNTVDVINQYINRGTLKLKCVKNEVNSGPAISRNKGVSLALGTYITFCDSDDWYEPDYLQKMIEAARTKNADMVFCGYRLIVENTTRTISHRLSLSENCLNNKRELLIAPIDSLWATMTRKDILLKVPAPDIRTAEDMAVIPVLISLSNRFACVPDCIYNYLSRKSSVSMSPVEGAKINGLISFEFIKNRIERKYSEEVEFLGARNIVYGYLLTVFSHGYDKEKARKMLNAFEVHCPHWGKNRHLKKLPVAKRIFLFASYKRWFLILRLLSIIHYKIVS